MEKFYTTEEYKKNIPHKMPAMLEIAVANACNLKCEYCSNSSESFVHAKPFMEYDTFCDVVDNISKSSKIVGSHPNIVILIGAGEPLLNTKIVDMVRYIKKHLPGSIISITTNGTLLNESMSDGLIDAGLDIMRVSLNGLSDEDYIKYTGTKIDYNKMYDQLKYFHVHAKSCFVYLKTMKYMLTDGAKEKEFYKWSECADFLNVEYVAEIPVEGVDYERLRKGNEDMNMKGNKLGDVPFCPLPFIQCAISEEGIVAGCCVAQLISGIYPKELIIGDLKNNLLCEIWNGDTMNKLRLSLINQPVGVCAKCNHYKQCCDTDESLVSEKERLIKYLSMGR